MTIEEAIKKLNAYIFCESKKARYNCDNKCDDNCNLLYEMGTVGEHNEAICKAIRSLEAWEAIKTDISEYKDDNTIHADHAERSEMIDIMLEIIDKHLQEVEE